MWKPYLIIPWTITTILFDPPQRIQERTDLFGAGMKTTDEMLQFIITYLPYELGDEEIEL